jgi:hypothetical protein
MRLSHRNRRGGSLRSSTALLALAFVAGCYSPPRRAAEVMVNPPSVDGATRVDEMTLPSGYWRQDGPLEPRAVLAKGRRVVVTAFDVELVELQFQPPTSRQLIFKPMVIIPVSGPVALAMAPIGILDLIGVGRRKTEIAEDQRQTLASNLYAAFLQDLRQRGLDVVPQDDLLANAAYAELPKQPEARSSLLMGFNPVGTDTGVVLRTRTVPAPGLGILQGAQRDQEVAEARILRETRADVALAVRLRVGIFRGKPALEQRSMIRLTTLEGSTTLRARHSLVTDLVAAVPARFQPLVGRIQQVDSQTFSSELTAMLPKFIALALVDSKR